MTKNAGYLCPITARNRENFDGRAVTDYRGVLDRGPEPGLGA